MNIVSISGFKKDERKKVGSLQKILNRRLELEIPKIREKLKDYYLYGKPIE